MGAFPIHLSSHFCYTTYHLATIYFVTDRQMDRQTIPHYNGNSWSQYDLLERLALEVIFIMRCAI